MGFAERSASHSLSLAVVKLPRASLVVAVASVALGTGCWKPGWESMSAPDVGDTNAMAAVESFIATNGWNMHSGGLAFTYGGEQTQAIRGLPWRSLQGRQFPAITHEGILYVILGGWHHDCHGIAYNPKTNRFSSAIAGFKPIGSHWYVWAQPEDPLKMKQVYEGGR